MPYQYSFRPQQLCKVTDVLGNVQEECPIQIFKPLLGCSFNETNAKPSHLLNSGGLILRGMLHWDPEHVDLGKLGVEEWSAASSGPYFQLGEDPESYRWYINDGLNWDAGGGAYLLSYFASKRTSLVPPGTPVAGLGGVAFVPNKTCRMWASTKKASTDPPTYINVPVMFDWQVEPMLNDHSTYIGSTWLRIGMTQWRTTMLQIPLRTTQWEILGLGTNPWYYYVKWWDFVDVATTNEHVVMQIIQVNADRTATPANR